MAEISIPQHICASGVFTHRKAIFFDHSHNSRPFTDQYAVMKPIKAKLLGYRLYSNLDSKRIKFHNSHFSRLLFMLLLVTLGEICFCEKSDQNSSPDSSSPINSENNAVSNGGNQALQAQYFNVVPHSKYFDFQISVPASGDDPTLFYTIKVELPLRDHIKEMVVAADCSDQSYKLQDCLDRMVNYERYLYHLTTNLIENEQIGNHNKRMFTNYCDPSISEGELQKYSRGQQKNVRVSELLPNHNYRIQSDLTGTGSQNGTQSFISVANFMCTKKDVPMLPPATDMGAFMIQNRAVLASGSIPRLAKYRLYWAAVPSEFAGDNPDKLSYNVHCEYVGMAELIRNPSSTDENSVQHHDVTSENSAGDPIDQNVKATVATIHKDPNNAMKCTIHAVNSIGTSKQSSIILLPEHHDTLDIFGDGKIYVLAQNTSTYTLKWTVPKLEPDVHQFHTLPLSANETNAAKNKFLYTIYWSTSAGTSGIDGIVHSESSNATITLPNESAHHRESIHFGISYHLAPAQYSGIIWSKCVFNTALDHSNYHPVNLDQVTTSSSISVKLTWKFIECESLTAFVKLFEIQRCRMKVGSDCSEVWFWDFQPDNHTAIEDGFTFDTCERNDYQNYTNNLVNQLDLTTLTPSTTYAFRVRYLSEDERWSNWSKPVITTTKSDSAKRDRCRVMLTIVIIVVFIVVIVCFIFSIIQSTKTVRRWRSILSRFNQTRTGVVQRIENLRTHQDRPGDLSGLSLKYWVDLFPDQDHNLLSRDSQVAIATTSTMTTDTNTATTSRNTDSSDSVQIQNGLSKFEDNGARDDDDEECPFMVNQSMDYVPCTMLVNSTVVHSAGDVASDSTSPYEISETVVADGDDTLDQRAVDEGGNGLTSSNGDLFDRDSEVYYEDDDMSNTSNSSFLNELVRRTLRSNSGNEDNNQGDNEQNNSESSNSNNNNNYSE